MLQPRPDCFFRRNVPVPAQPGAPATAGGKHQRGLQLSRGALFDFDVEVEQFFFFLVADTADLHGLEEAEAFDVCF